MNKALLICAIFICLPALLLAGRNRPNKANRESSKPPKQPKDCSEWQEGPCIPQNNETCGEGLKTKTRTGDNCPLKVKSGKCKVPCPADAATPSSCRYKKGPWSACDAATNKKSRTLTLKTKRRRGQAINPPSTCEPTKTVQKPCNTKQKKEKARTTSRPTRRGN